MYSNTRTQFHNLPALIVATHRANLVAYLAPHVLADVFPLAGGWIKDREIADIGMVTTLLLDRDGKIISANMTRPSDPKTAEKFNELSGL